MIWPIKLSFYGLTELNHFKFMELKHTFEDYLQETFDAMGVYGETPITKDNCKNLYELWVENLDLQEVIDYADKFGTDLTEKIILNSCHKFSKLSNYEHAINDTKDGLFKQYLKE